MNDLTKSLADWFKEKTSSSLYFTYFTIAIFWNWKIFYVFFFEDSLLFGAPRIEYVSDNLSFHTYFLDSSILNATLDLFLNILQCVGVPAALTFLAVKYLPRLNAWAHKIETENYFERKKVYDQKRVEYEKEQTRFLKEEARQKEQQHESKNVIQMSLTQEEKWGLEFQKITDDDITAIKDGVQIVYEKYGRFTTNLSDANDADYKYIPYSFYARLDALGLIGVNKSLMDFTEKGKYFVRKLQEQKIFSKV